MLHFQFNSHQFHPTSHLSSISWGSCCLFWPDYHNILTVEVCFVFFFHSFTSVSLSLSFLPLPPHLFPEHGLVLGSGHPCVTTTHWQGVCSHLQLPPSTSQATSSRVHSPLRCLHSTCLYQTSAHIWDISWSLCCRPASSPLSALPWTHCTGDFWPYSYPLFPYTP